MLCAGTQGLLHTQRHFTDVCILSSDWQGITTTVVGTKIASDACTPQPREIVCNTMRYRSSETVHRSSGASFIKGLTLSLEAGLMLSQGLKSEPMSQQSLGA